MDVPLRPPAPQADVADLALAVRRDEPDALDAWFRAEHPRVWKVCFGMLADSAEADDLAQDAMLHLADRLDRWDPDRAYVPWRNAVVANLCRDRWRSLAARREETGAHPNEEGAGTLPDRLPDPVTAAQRTEVRDLLRSVLGTLSPREREVYVLRDLEGEDTHGVAQALGITESSVRSLLTLARRRLRQVIGSRLPGLVPDGGDA